MQVTARHATAERRTLCVLIMVVNSAPGIISADDAFAE